MHRTADLHMDLATLGPGHRGPRRPRSNHPVGTRYPPQMVDDDGRVGKLATHRSISPKPADSIKEDSASPVCGRAEHGRITGRFKPRASGSLLYLGWIRKPEPPTR